MDIERVISELLIFILGAVCTTAFKFFRDINAAHRKIRKLEQHLGLDDDSERVKKETVAE